MRTELNLVRHGTEATEPMKIEARYLYTAKEAASLPDEQRCGYMIIECEEDHFRLHILARHAAALAHAILDAQYTRAKEMQARASAAVTDASNG